MKPGRLLALFVVSFMMLASMPAFLLTAEAIAPEEVYVDATYDSGTPGWEVTHFDNIQDAIDAVAAGGTINVVAGTYRENPDIDGKSLTIRGIPDNDVLPIIEGTLRIANSAGPTTIEYLSFIANFDGHNDPWSGSHNNSIHIRSANDITIKHCNFDGSGRFMGTPYSQSAINVNSSSDITLDTCRIENGYYMAIYGLSGGTDNLTVKDSTFDNIKSGINLNVGENLVVENTDISVVAQAVDSDSYCVRIATNSVVYGSPIGVKDMTITGGTFTVDKNGFEAEEGTNHAAIVIRSQAQGDLEVRDAKILGEVLYLTEVGGFPADQIEDGAVEPVGLDANWNWWGSPSYPDGRFSDGIEVTSWALDEDFNAFGTYYQIEDATDPFVIWDLNMAFVDVLALDEGDELVFNSGYDDYKLTFPVGILPDGVEGIALLQRDVDYWLDDLPSWLKGADPEGAPTGFMFRSKIFRFVLMEFAGEEPEEEDIITQFTGNFTLVFYFDPAEVDNPDMLDVYWFDGDEWVALGGVVDMVAGTVTVEVDHWSDFALMEEEETTPETGTAVMLLIPLGMLLMLAGAFVIRKRVLA